MSLMTRNEYRRGFFSPKVFGFLGYGGGGSGDGYNDIAVPVYNIDDDWFGNDQVAVGGGGGEKRERQNIKKICVPMY